MAQNIFEQFGMKEVADVQFEALESDSRLGVAAGDIVLYLDTLKVSTIETTAEQTEAKGGKGAPPLVIWDFGKEITLTLQDALFTIASLATICGAAVNEASSEGGETIRVTEEVTSSAAGAITLSNDAIADQKIRYIKVAGEGLSGVRGQVTALAGKSQTIGSASDVKYRVFYDILAYEAGGDTVMTESSVVEVEGNIGIFPVTYEPKSDSTFKVGTNTALAANEWMYANGSVIIDLTVANMATDPDDGETVTVVYTYVAEARGSIEITIDANNFPGTYKVFGDTLVRNKNGVDTRYQFVVPRAKVGSETTFTMESEGDPAVFDMNLRVLRDDDGTMIKFKKYNL